MAATPPHDGTDDGTDQTPENLTTVGATVMSFNIRYKTSNDTGVTHWDSRKEAVCDFILNSGVGIMGLQEVKETQYFDLRDRIDRNTT